MGCPITKMAKIYFFKIIIIKSPITPTSGLVLPSNGQIWPQGDQTWLAVAESGRTAMENFFFLLLLGQIWSPSIKFGRCSKNKKRKFSVATTDIGGAMSLAAVGLVTGNRAQRRGWVAQGGGEVGKRSARRRGWEARHTTETTGLCT